MVCVAAMCGAAPAWASSASYYVNASTGSASITCGASASPCASIQGALDAAAHAADGSPTVYVSGTVNEYNISISGNAFPGLVTIEQDPSPSASPGTIKETAQANSLFVVQSGANLTVSGLTLDGSAYEDGASIDDESSGTVTASNDTFKGGPASGYNGGAIYENGGGALVVNSDTFTTGAAAGGAIYVNDGASLTVVGSTFGTWPSGDSTGSGNGGAIELNDAATSVEVADSTFAGDVGFNGGAIADDAASSLTISGSTFYRNTAAGSGSGSDGQGGGLYISAAGGTVQVLDSTFDGNTDHNYGYLASTNASSDGNNVYVAAGAPTPSIAGDLFYGTCAFGQAPDDAGYNAATDGSCLATSPPRTDRSSPDVGDLSGAGIETGAAQGAPQTVTPGAANPAAGLIPENQSVLGGTSLCPQTDEAGVASTGACNAGASQAVTPRPVMYVAAGGSNSGDCTGSACATIAYALTQQNQYSDPTVHLSGDISEGNIAIAEDATIDQDPAAGAAAAKIDGTGLNSSQPLFDITGGTVLISGITIENAPGGGAVTVSDPGETVTFTSDTFSSDQNTVTYDGGAIANVSTGTVAVDGESSFTGDTAGSAGGAIWVGDGGTVRINEGTTASTDSATFADDSARFGGAIGVGIGGSGGGTLQVNRTTFTADSATDAGGAIDTADNSAGSVSVSYSVFGGITSALGDTAGYGGAIDNGDDGGNANAHLAVSNSFFGYDASSVDGGAIDNGDRGGSSPQGANAVIELSSFYHDRAGYDGGAIDNGDEGGPADLMVVNDTFADDQATGWDGGAIANNDVNKGVIAGTGDGGNMVAASSTFSGDTAAYEGDLIYQDSPTPGSAQLGGNIFDGTCAVGSGTTFMDAGYNAATDGSCIGGGTADQTGAAAGTDLAAPSGTFETLTPIWGNPAIGLVPGGTTVTTSNFGYVSVCPITDILGNHSVGPCNAGALQTYTPVAPLRKVTGVTATAGVGQATVTWNAPSLDDVGGQFGHFTVIPRNVTTGSDEPAQTTNGNVTSLVLAGLTAGDSYTFTVVTDNSVGAGPASDPSAAVTIQSPRTTTTTTTPTTTTPTTTTPTTTTPTTTTPGSAQSRAVTATTGNQKLTLALPTACVAPGRTASVKLSSAVIAGSKKPKLKFVSAVLTLGGKQAHTTHSGHVSVSFSLKGLKPGSYRVKAMLTFRESRPHGRSVTVTKTLTASLSIC